MQDVFNPDTSQGNGLASLLLGWGTAGHVGTQPPVADKTSDQGIFIQDDWKVSQRLTLNLGLRYEWSTPFTERFNRLVIVDYNGDTGIDVPGLGRLHGTSYLADANKRTANIDRNNLGPRFGFAYRLDQKTVVRGGAGVYYGYNVATNFQYVGTPWYKNVTMYFSKDGGITPYASLSDPFPTPPGFVGPPGPKYGKLAQWGFDNGYNLNDALRNAEIYQWNIGIERELPGNMMIEANYTASRSTLFRLTATTEPATGTSLIERTESNTVATAWQNWWIIPSCLTSRVLMPSLMNPTPLTMTPRSNASTCCARILSFPEALVDILNS